MFLVKSLVTGSVVISTSDLVNAETYLEMIDTEPSSHEIVEVADVTE